MVSEQRSNPGTARKTQSKDEAKDMTVNPLLNQGGALEYLQSHTSSFKEIKDILQILSIKQQRKVYVYEICGYGFCLME